MKRFFFGTGITKNYISQAEACLTSLSQCGGECFCVTVGFDADKVLRARYPDVMFLPLEDTDITVRIDYGCIQHGDFLPCLEQLKGGLKDEDVILFMDADTSIQRDLTAAERQRFLSYEDHTIGFGYNSGPKDTLRAEFERIRPRIPLGLLEVICGPLDVIPVYNGGLIIGSVNVWKQVRKRFSEEWPKLDPCFGHYARNQWILCWVVHTLGLHIDVLGYGIHANGHYALPCGSSYDGTVLRFQKEVCFLRHKLEPRRITARLIDQLPWELLPDVAAIISSIVDQTYGLSLPQGDNEDMVRVWNHHDS